MAIFVTSRLLRDWELSYYYPYIDGTG